MAETPRYLSPNGPRVLDEFTIAPVAEEAWLEWQRPGFLLRFVLTPQELDEMIEVLQQVRKQLPGGENAKEL